MGVRKGVNGIAGGCVLRRRVAEGFQLGDVLIVVTQLSETRVSVRVFAPSEMLFKRLTAREAVAAMQQRTDKSAD